MNTNQTYQTIQAAVNDAREGDTIWVGSGTYPEHITVEKPISLVGESKYGTVVDGCGTGNVVYITADHVAISGFTVTNSGKDWRNAGIFLTSSHMCNVSGNIMSDNYSGLHLERQSMSNTLSDNQVCSNTASGIYLDYQAHGNTVKKNNVSRNIGSGIVIVDCNDNYIPHNTVTLNEGEGFELRQSVNTLIDSNTLTSNRGAGVVVSYSPNTTLINNTIASNSHEAIHLAPSNHCVIAHNNISNNEWSGIDGEGSQNFIHGNTIKNNGWWAVDLSSSEANVITGNTMSSNNGGIRLAASTNNTLYHNNFISSTRQVDVADSANWWDYGYPSGGNYWSDYPGIDAKTGGNHDLPGSDGIGDSAYIIPYGEEDRYPLTYEWQGVGLVVSDIPDIMFPEDNVSMPLDLDDYVTDPDTPHTQISWFLYNNRHTCMNLDPQTHIAEFDADPNWYGAESVEIMAKDPEGHRGGQFVKILVESVNDPPQLGAIPNQSGIEDTEWQLDITPYITDIDTPINQISVATNSTYATVLGRTIRLKYPDGITQEKIKMVISDGEHEAARSIAVDITPVNDAPVLSDIPDITAPEDTPQTIDLTKYVIDIDNEPNEMKWSTSGAEKIQVSILLGKAALIPPENWHGTETLIFTVQDPEGLRDANIVRVTYTPINDPPIFSLKKVEVVEDIPYMLDASKYLEDPDDDLSRIKVSTRSPHVTIQDHTMIFLYPNGVLTDEVKVNVSDGESNTMTFLVVDVEPVNDPPVIKDIPTVDLPPRGSCHLDLDSYVTDPDDPCEDLTWLVTHSPGVRVDVDEARRLKVKCLQEALPEEILSLTVKDRGGLSDQADITVRIAEPLFLILVPLPVLLTKIG